MQSSKKQLSFNKLSDLTKQITLSNDLKNSLSPKEQYYNVTEQKQVDEVRNEGVLRPRNNTLVRRQVVVENQQAAIMDRNMLRRTIFDNMQEQELMDDKFVSASRDNTSQDDSSMQLSVEEAKQEVAMVQQVANEMF